MKNLIKKIIPYFDIFLVPFLFPAALLLKSIRKAGVQRLPFCKKTLFRVGVFPIRNHYYEPLFDMRKIKSSLHKERNLPGINWRIQEQLEFIEKLKFANELKNLPTERTGVLQYYLNNTEFKSGDAEFWYQLIRLKKPRSIIEIGSGNSTLMAMNAIRKNKEENAEYFCNHICIEPYEQPWLEKTGVTILRKKVEELETSFFSELGEDDILFIDSSHIIKPEGDILFEYLELLPGLNKGVIVHLHDIFSPRNYSSNWLISEVKFWNEQYLLEAFLSHNNSWKIIGSLNYLHHRHYEKLKSACPFLTQDSNPGSFYIQKIDNE